MLTAGKLGSFKRRTNVARMRRILRADARPELVVIDVVAST